MASLKADENDVNLKNKDDELETEPSSVNKKSIIIVTIIVLVAAAFAVGIYFAIEGASNSKQ
jgi:flagellar basal body-associated protein FliL